MQIKSKVKWIKLPPEVESAIENDPYDGLERGKITVTALISPPRQYQLLQRHKKEISRGAGRYLAFLGQGIHTAMERCDLPGAIKEQRFKVRMLKYQHVITGKIDLYLDEVITDYKVVAMRAADYVHEEWAEQLNLLTLLLRHNGHEVKKVRNMLFYRDWNPIDYERGIIRRPPVEIQVQPLWPEEKTLKFLDERLSFHIASKGLEDSMLPKCTKDETWETPTIYRMIKPGKTRAFRICKTIDEANAIMIDHPNLRMDVVKGMPIRCELFCEARQFCNQYEVYAEMTRRIDYETERIRNLIKASGSKKDSESPSEQIG